MSSHNQRLIVNIAQATNQTPPSSPLSLVSSTTTDVAPAVASEQQVIRHSIREAMRLGTAFVVVPRYVGPDLSDDEHSDDFTVHRIIPRAPPRDCRHEERVFLVEFQESMIALLKDLRRHFPYQQKIEWTIEYGNDKEHTFHILIKSPRSTRSRD